MGWIEYYKLKPFGDDWDQTAIIAELISLKVAERKLNKSLDRSDIIPYQKDSRTSRLLELKQELDRRKGRRK